MELDSLDLLLLNKSWNGKDPFDLPEHQVNVLGRVYFKSHHLVLKSSRQSNTSPLGVQSQPLKHSTKPYGEEKRNETKTNLQLLDKFGGMLVNSRCIKVIINVFPISNIPLT